METNNNTNIVTKNLDLSAKKELYELWKKTPKLSMNAFCKQRGIPTTTFHQWCKRFDYNNKTKNSKSNSRWMSINLRQQSNKQKEVIHNETANLELLLPSNIRVRINITTNKIVHLIQELCHAATIIR